MLKREMCKSPSDFLPFLKSACFLPTQHRVSHLFNKQILTFFCFPEVQHQEIRNPSVLREAQSKRRFGGSILVHVLGMAVDPIHKTIDPSWSCCLTCSDTRPGLNLQHLLTVSYLE